MKSEKRYLILFLCLAILLTLIPSVSAVVYSGNLGGNGVQQNLYAHSSGGLTSTGPNNVTGFIVQNFDTIGTPSAIIQYEGTTYPMYNDTWALPQASGQFKVYLSNASINASGYHTYIGRYVGSGTFGYQKVYDTAIPANFLYSYIYFVWNDWVPGAETGTQYLAIVGDYNQVYHVCVPWGDSNQFTSDPFSFSNARASGGWSIETDYSSSIYNRDISALADYTIGDNSGSGIIIGNINKDKGLSQGIIYSSTGTVLASESANSPNMFTFTLPSQSVIVGIKNSIGTKFNSSVLAFTYNTSFPTPTPTLIIGTTPTPTPSPIGGGSNGTWTIITYDASNLTQITGSTISLLDISDMGAGWFNVTANDGSYVFGGYGTGGNKPFVIGHTYGIGGSKTGYQSMYQSQLYTSSIASSGRYGIDLTPLSVLPANNNVFSLYVQLYDASTGYLVSMPLSGTVIAYNQSSSWTAVYSNPSAGSAFFSGLTPSSSYKFVISLNGYQSYTGYFTSSLSMGGTNQIMTVSLVPTSIIPNGAYTLSASPSSGGFNDTYTLTISGDLSSAKKVSFTAYTSSSNYPFYFKVGSYQSNYQLVGGTWKIWDGSNWQTSSLPQSISVKFPAFGNTGNYIVDALITSNSDNTYDVKSNINIVASGNIKLQWLVVDGTHQLTTITPYNVYLYDMNNQIWTNKTFTLSDTLYGTDNIAVNPNINIQYYVSAANYFSSPLTSYSVGIYNPPAFNVVLEPFNNLPVSNSSLAVNVRRASDYWLLPNVKVSLSDGQIQYTDSNGHCVFTVLNNTYYKAIASPSTGYMSGTGSTTTGIGSNTIFISLLQMSNTTPNPYPTGSPTNIATTIPINPVYTINSTPGFQCVGITSNSSAFDQLKNYLACNGINTKEGQNAILGLIIMIFSGSLMAKYGKGMGAIAGVIAGAAISFYMQLLPFWLLIFVCVACGVVFAGKIFGSGK